MYSTINKANFSGFGTIDFRDNSEVWVVNTIILINAADVRTFESLVQPELTMLVKGDK